MKNEDVAKYSLEEAFPGVTIGNVHDVDYIIYLLGKPEAVVSYGEEDDDNISYISSHFEYKNIVIEAEGGWYNAPIPFSMSFRAAFEKAVLEFSNGKLIVYEKENDSKTVEYAKIKGQELGFNIDSINAYTYELHYFVECIKNGKPPEMVKPESAIECLEILLKELESIRTGRKILL